MAGGPWDSWYATENWAALVREDDFGVGIWSPGSYQYTGGFAGKPGQGGPKDGRQNTVDEKLAALVAARFFTMTNLFSAAIFV